jgi:hypothetical protein
MTYIVPKVRVLKACMALKLPMLAGTFDSCRNFRLPQLENIEDVVTMLAYRTCPIGSATTR